jgi:hypothetical protein
VFQQVPIRTPTRFARAFSDYLALQALQINPTSFLIAFSYAEYEERHGNNELAKNIYENLAARNDIDPTLVCQFFLGTIIFFYEYFI